MKSELILLHWTCFNASAMADDANRDTNEFLYREVQRLAKEKEELEDKIKKNKEKQLLEQKIKELRSSVSSLKSGENSASRGDPLISPRRTIGVTQNNEDEEDLESSLQESHDNLRVLQSQLFSTPSSGTKGSIKGHRSVISGKAKDLSTDSSSDNDGDDVMSQRYKRAIQDNRDILVENMIADDIFNDLISRKILTSADVSRIKERNTREAINEELLDNLCRRSDRAFRVFVQSLRKTLQEHLANRLEPSSSARRKKRKRQAGELNINIDCDDVTPAKSSQRRQREARMTPQTTSKAQCSCQEVEEQILQMAKDAYRNIRRRDATPASFEQFRKELQQTNTIIKDSMEIMHTLKILCRHGDLIGISEGSIQLSMRCHSAAAARELWKMYTSGAMLKLIQHGFVTSVLRRKCRAKEILLKVRMLEEEYLLCIQELDDHCNEYDASALSKPQMQRLQYCKDKPLFDNKIPHGDPNLDTRPRLRQAFQEITENHHVCLSPYHPLQRPPSSSKSYSLSRKHRKRKSPFYNLRFRASELNKKTVLG